MSWGAITAPQEFLKELLMLKILTVCGNGQGSSLILRLGLEPALEELGVKDQVMIEATSAGQAQGLIPFADLVVCAEQFHGLIDVPKNKPIVFVTNLVNKKEVKEKVFAALKEHFPHLLPSED